jgi:hypothetical protein
MKYAAALMTSHKTEGLVPTRYDAKQLTMKYAAALMTSHKTEGLVPTKYDAKQLTMKYAAALTTSHNTEGLVHRFNFACAAVRIQRVSMQIFQTLTERAYRLQMWRCVALPSLAASSP